MLNSFDKSYLREYHKEKRLEMGSKNKDQKDSEIFKRLIKTDLFEKSDVILTYVSTDLEINTHNIIKYSVSLGKKVAVPLSDSQNLKMSFYFINSINDLKLGNFSVLEPTVDRDKLCSYDQMENSICLVPGLLFGKDGHRIGYGKGYYDRFLSEFKGASIGLCYESDLLNTIPYNEHDVPVNNILSEKSSIALREE